MVIELNVTLRAIVEVDEREWKNGEPCTPANVIRHFRGQLDSDKVSELTESMVNMGAEVGHVDVLLADETPFVGAVNAAQ